MDLGAATVNPGNHGSGSVALHQAEAHIAGICP